MRINHNITALNTYNKLTSNTAATAKSLEKLSSGLKINKAGDNAAGLAISEKMRGQIRGLDQASTNASDAISLINTAEGALSETHSILQRMRELAVQSSNDTNVTIDRSEIQKEMNQLTSEINRIGNTTEFNTQKLLNGGGSKITSLASGVAETVAGGKAGAVSDVSTTTGSVTGKSKITVTAGATTFTIEANNIENNLAGKTIEFNTVGGAGNTAVVSGNSTNIRLNVTSGTQIGTIQAALSGAGFLSSNGGVKITATTTATGAALATTHALGNSGVTGLNTVTNGDSVSFSNGNGTATKGVYSIDIKEAFVRSGDTFKLKLATGITPDGWAEITLTADQSGANVATGNLAGTFNIGSGTVRLTAEQQAANIVTALKSAVWDLSNGGVGGNKDITDVYDIRSNGSEIIFTEKTALGSQAKPVTGAVASQAVKETSTYTHSEMVGVGGSFIIDGVEIAVVDGTGATDTEDIAAGRAILRTATSGNTLSGQMAKLADAVTSNAALNKYTAVKTNDTLVLTQKAGFESSTGVVMEVSNKAGQTFTANFQIGANTAQSMTIDVNDMRSLSLKIAGRTASGTQVSKDGTVTASYTSDKVVTDGTTNTGTEYALDVSTHQKATAAITIINDAIENVSAERSKLGSYQNRLEHTINNLGTSSENLTTAESRIRDVDMAKEMMEFTKNNILSQAAQSMLAQANQQPQGVLQLLQ